MIVRTTMTLILRLLIDESQPETLHGVMQTVASNEEYTFSDGLSLLELLRLKQSEWLRQPPVAEESIKPTRRKSTGRSKRRAGNS